MKFAHFLVVFLLIITGFGLSFFVQPLNVLAQVSDTPNPNTWVTDGTVYAIATAGPITYIGGGFTYVGPNTGSGALISPTTGNPISPYLRINGPIYAVVPDGSGGWYIGGAFTQVAGVDRSRIAHILSNGALDNCWNPGANNDVLALGVSGGTIYAGGRFTTIGGQARNYIAAIDITTGLATPWNPNASYYVHVLAVSGGTIYAGGEFSVIGGYTRYYLAAIDAVTGAVKPWNPIANSNVFALAVSGGTVYAGGEFSVIGGQTRYAIAAIDAATGAVTPWNPAPYGSVYALAVSGGTVYAGVKPGYLHFIDAVTGEVTWSLRFNVASGDSSVNTLVVNGGTLYVGGTFTSAGGRPEKQYCCD